MKTVKVRIAVAIDHNDDWNACGWAGGEDEEMMENVESNVGFRISRYWITAELPVVEDPVIEGVVEEATKVVCLECSGSGYLHGYEQDE